MMVCLEVIGKRAIKKREGLSSSSSHLQPPPNHFFRPSVRTPAAAQVCPNAVPALPVFARPSLGSISRSVGRIRLWWFRLRLAVVAGKGRGKPTYDKMDP